MKQQIGCVRQPTDCFHTMKWAYVLFILQSWFFFWATTSLYICFCWNVIAKFKCIVFCVPSKSICVTSDWKSIKNFLPASWLNLSWPLDCFFATAHIALAHSCFRQMPHYMCCQTYQSCIISRPGSHCWSTFQIALLIFSFRYSSPTFHYIRFTYKGSQHV